MNSVEFGKLVVRKRRELGLSQSQFGEMIWRGDSRSSVQKAISLIENSAWPEIPKIHSKIHERIKDLCVFLKIDDICLVNGKPTKIWDVLTPDIFQEELKLIMENNLLAEFLSKEISILVEKGCSNFRNVLVSSD